MGTLTLATMRSLIRSNLNELGTSMITDSELNIIINDGYKDVCSKSRCYETKLTKTNIPTSVRMIPIESDNVVRVNYVEYDLGTSGCIGLMEIMPTVVGHVSINNYTPQYWFQWGNFVIIEPLPDVGTYDVNIYATCYPSSVLSADSDLPSVIPVEFYESILQFALTYISVKLSRWANMSLGYNLYINTIQRKMQDYLNPIVDSRFYTELPGEVTLEVSKNG